MSRSPLIVLAVASCALVTAACGPSERAPADPDPGWQQLSGTAFSSCDPGASCDWKGVGNEPVTDFAFDGDDVLVIGNRVNVRLALSTGQGGHTTGFNRGPHAQLEVVGSTIFAKGDAEALVLRLDRTGAQTAAWGSTAVDLRFEAPLRATADGHLLTVGPLVASPYEGALVDVDPTVMMTTTELPLPDWNPIHRFSVAVDDAGRVFYESASSPSTAPALRILDRSTGTTTRVAVTPPDGAPFPAYLQGKLLGTAPGGGILAIRSAQTGEDVVRIDATGATTLVIHSELALSSVTRLRVRDGYLYASGLGLWRTTRRVF